MHGKFRETQEKLQRPPKDGSSKLSKSETLNNWRSSLYSKALTKIRSFYSLPSSYIANTARLHELGEKRNGMVNLRPVAMAV
uniref:Uncharacterized protein n=1 Tax=Oryza punctata TaxID=4537 RepID=A0A1V1H907_ORYPU|nr:hypothetical protein [Oryza punctata]